MITGGSSILSVVVIIEEPYVVSFGTKSRPLIYFGRFRLTSVFTSRFLINLQKVKHRQTGSSQSLSQVSDLAFEPNATRTMDGFIGSLGAQEAVFLLAFKPYLCK